MAKILELKTDHKLLSIQKGRGVKKLHIFSMNHPHESIYKDVKYSAKSL